MADAPAPPAAAASAATTATTSPSRPAFNPVDTTSPAHPATDDVESPSLSSSNALARFEFEPGRGRDGTKVLMVEWEEDDSTRDIAGDWEISWEGKKTVLPARDASQAQSAALGSAGSDDPLPQAINRLYFLLGPGVAVPPAVHLQKGPIAWKTNPLPAIFPPELGATARQAGQKGVLHTIWAKKRVQVLQAEIAQESKDNGEGIGLQMAVAEKEWIEQNFGIIARPPPLGLGLSTTGHHHLLNSPTSPRTPGGGRFLEKLKGLKLGTTERELSHSSTAGSEEQTVTGGDSASHLHHSASNPLSPEMSDVAVGTFANFAVLKGAPPPSTMAAKPPQRPSGGTTAAAISTPTPPSAPAPVRKITAQRPPDSFLASARGNIGGGGGGMGSLAGALAQSTSDASATTAGSESNNAAEQDDATESDLFALPMSPRSPEMTKSPFSFAQQDLRGYVAGERA